MRDRLLTWREIVRELWWDVLDRVRPPDRSGRQLPPGWVKIPARISVDEAIDLLISTRTAQYRADGGDGGAP